MGEWDRVINWWNVMETTFVFTMGACLTLGILLNRKLIAAPNNDAVVRESPAIQTSTPLAIVLVLEGILLIVHVSMLVSSEFIPGSSVSCTAMD